MINLCSIIYIFLGIILYMDTYLKMVIIHFYLYYGYTFIDGMLYSYDTSWIYVYIMYNMLTYFVYT